MGQRIVLVSLLQEVVICIMERKNKFIKLNEIITWYNKWLKTNITQSIEFGYSRTVAPLFGGYNSAYAFQQKAQLVLARIQEP